MENSPAAFQGNRDQKSRVLPSVDVAQKESSERTSIHD